MTVTTLTDPCDECGGELVELTEHQCPLGELIELFPMTWDEKIKALALRRKGMQLTDPGNWSPKQRQDWRLTNLELGRLLNEVPG